MYRNYHVKIKSKSKKYKLNSIKNNKKLLPVSEIRQAGGGVVCLF